MVRLPTLMAALLTSGSVFAANQTRDFGDGKIAVVADVYDAKLDRTRTSSEFSIMFGSPGRDDSDKSWANGVTMYCSPGRSTIFVNGAGSFSFKIGQFESLKPAISVYTDTVHVPGIERDGLSTHPEGFSVWSGLTGKDLMTVLEGLGRGESVYFRIDEAKSAIKAVTLNLVGYEGHNNFSAFRSDCARLANQGA